MKNLLSAIQTQLRTDLAYVKDKCVFITEDEDIIPDWADFPAVGIKDGEIERVKRPGGALEILRTISIIAYVDLLKDEATIMGDDSISAKGLLDMTADIHASLDGNVLGLSGYNEAFSPEELASETVEFKEQALQRKIIKYQYDEEQ